MSNLAELLKNKRQEINESTGFRQKAVKPPQGKSIIRILPTWKTDGSQQFWHDFGNHYVKDEKGDLKAVYVCVDKTYNRPCEICEAIRKSYDHAATDGQIKALDESKASGRVVLNALMRAGTGADPKKPFLLDISPKMFGQIIDIWEEYGDIFDVEEGLDLVFNRTGTGMKTEYSVQPCPPKKNTPTVSKAVIDQIVDLDEWAAQEFEAGAKKALTAVSATVGLLAAPSSSSSSTKAISSDGSLGAESEESDDDGLEDILDADYEEVSDEPASSAPVNESVDDDELDDLLGDLENL